jgi:7-carboxy-7-deazaguanine synthase
VYSSVQGEGPNVGKQTVFVRFGGCNLRCPGWPCDTQHAIDPKFRAEWIKTSIDDLLGQIGETGIYNVTLTGGEPFLQPKDDLQQLCEILVDFGYSIDCFSNGTIEYPFWAPIYITFIMDWKLPGSGEDPMNKTRIENLTQLNASGKQQAVKFVINDRNDYNAAKALYSDFLKGRLNIEVYYGRVWDAEITDATLAEWVMRDKLPWRMNVQLHNYIWPANERRR